MEDNVITQHKIVRELAELSWRINKLEEMRNSRDLKEQILGTEDEFLQSQCYQFFLGLRFSYVCDNPKLTHIEWL
jgi:hypothetical protein